ncbi:MAG: hypothetical protein P9X27_03365 [Candidatus Kaelpia aquatica]|nr:hypothetical protein [Candidatus Kaelpia aquatica]
MNFLNSLVKVEMQYLIEIGSNYIRLALLEKNKDSLKVKKFDFFYTKGIKEDDLFWVLFKERLEAFSVPEARGVHLIFSPNYLLACAKVLPVIPKAEVISHCMHVLTRDMHITPSDCYLDHNIVKLEKDNVVVGMITGVKRSISDRVVDMLSKLGIDVERVETSIVSLENIFCGLGLIPREGSILVLRLEESYTEFFFMKDRVISSYKVSSFGLQDLKKSLIRTVYTNAGPIEISVEEAAEIVKSVGYPPKEGNYVVKSDRRLNILEKAGHPEVNEGALSIAYQQLRMLLAPALDSFSQELGVFISEYLGFFSEKEKIAGVCIIGSGASVKGLGEFLESRFAISYVCVDPLSVTDKIEVGADISDNYKTEMGLIPAALNRTSKRYNLTSPYYRIIKETHKAKNTIYVYLSGLAGFLLFFYLGLNLNMFYLEKITTRAENAYKELGPFSQKLKEVDKLYDNIESLEEKISQVYTDYFDWAGILKQISSVISDQIILEKIQGGAEGSERIVLLKGNISAEWGSLNTVLNSFVKKLEETVYFKEAKILDTIHKGYRNQLYFELKCYLN